MYLHYILGFILSFLLSLYGTPIARKAALQFNIVDKPDGRLKVHNDATPYLGGLAIYVSYIITMSLVFEFEKDVIGLMFAGSMIVIIGLLDDMNALPPGPKFIGQILATIVLIKYGIMVSLGILTLWANYILTLFWIVGITNAINIIDIMDGLAGSVSMIASCLLFAVAVINGRPMIAIMAIVLAGSLLGFLRYNLRPAKIYLGDTGSMFIGIMLSSLAMIGTYDIYNPIGVLTPIAILIVPIFDTGLVSVLRLIRGRSPFLGSKDHFALRLHKKGVSVNGIVVLSSVMTLIYGGIGLIASIIIIETHLLIIILSIMALILFFIAYWLSREKMY